MSLHTQKRELRKRLIARREDTGSAQKLAADRAIVTQLLRHEAVLTAGVAMVYVSLPTEVATHELIDALVSDGRIVLVPKIIDRTEMRAVRFPGWENMQAGSLGILAPREINAWPGTIDVAVVPGLGFTVAGQRLGFGAGYYDRWLTSYPALTKIGIAYRWQILPRLPVEPHDVAMDHVITDEVPHR